jgi:hypothetical protein
MEDRNVQYYLQCARSYVRFFVQCGHAAAFEGKYYNIRGAHVVFFNPGDYEERVSPQHCVLPCDRYFLTPAIVGDALEGLSAACRKRLHAELAKYDPKKACLFLIACNTRKHGCEMFFFLVPLDNTVPVLLD